MKKILAVCGSLRANSSNEILLKRFQTLAKQSEDLEVNIFQSLADLPHFNPDLESQSTHPQVARWRKALQQSQAVIISSPEYAHGTPGVLKNALDWLVGSGELMEKPVAVVTASASDAEFAHQSLLEVLKTMSAVVRPETSLSLAGIRSKVDVPSQSVEAKTSALLENILNQLIV